MRHEPVGNVEESLKAACAKEEEALAVGADRVKLPITSHAGGPSLSCAFIAASFRTGTSVS